MPKTKISEFSATPGNNTDIDGINLAEGCAPSGINDAIRELMSQLKDFQAGTAGDSFNGPVGTTTAAAGAFTTLSASSTVSGTGFSTYLASPPAIGGTAAAAGSFTTLSASSSVTLSGGTANGVAYLNGSKVLTSGSALVFDGSNLGLGVTPSAWGQLRAIDISTSGAVFGFSSQAGIANNTYYNGANFIYKNTAAAGYFRVNGGASEWFTAASGTAGTTISFTQAMTLDASGRLLLGTTASTFTFNNAVFASGSANAGVSIFGTGQTTLAFATATSGADSYRGYIQYTGGGTDTMVFATASTERARITSGGNLLVGTTTDGTPRVSVSGAVYSTSGFIIGTATNGTTGQFATDGNDTYIDYKGSLIYRSGGGTERARIPSAGGFQCVNSISVGNATPTTSGAGITFPATQSASSDANTLDDYEEGTWTPNIGGNATYTAQQGRYVKIGRLVYINAYFVVNTKGTGSDSTLSGLPFTRGDGNSGGSGLTVTYWSSSAVNLLYIAGNVNVNATTVTFNGTTSSATTANTVDAALFGDGTRIDFAGTYYASV